MAISETKYQDTLPLHEYAEVAARVLSGIPPPALIAKFKEHALTSEDVQAVLTQAVSDAKLQGRTWDEGNPNNLTMIGLMRLRGVCQHLQHVDAAGVLGHFIETGVWRGGCCIFAALLLRHMGNPYKRTVFACDSFCGLPPPDVEKYPVDRGDPHHTLKQLAVPLEFVQAHATAFGVFDDIRWVKGWFEDTLPTVASEGAIFAVTRLDGDMYSSTMQALQALEPVTSANGVVIIDDWSLPGAKAATNDYRRDHAISAPIIEYGDGIAMYWVKDSGTAPVPVPATATATATATASA